MTKSIFVRCATGVGIAGALTLLAAAPIAAAPALSSTAQVKSAAPNTATEARSRRRAWRRSYFIGSYMGGGGTATADAVSRAAPAPTALVTAKTTACFCDGAVEDSTSTGCRQHLKLAFTNSATTQGPVSPACASGRP
jgi:hypothetical protein